MSDPEVSLQLLRLLAALALGAGGGLLYDLLRPLRRDRGRAAELAADGLFCLTMGAAAFVFAMSSPSGRLGQWEIASVSCGFLAWLHLLSPRLAPWILRPRAGNARQFHKTERK